MEVRPCSAVQSTCLSGSAQVDLLIAGREGSMSSARCLLWSLLARGSPPCPARGLGQALSRGPVAERLGRQSNAGSSSSSSSEEHRTEVG